MKIYNVRHHLQTNANSGKCTLYWSMWYKDKTVIKSVQCFMYHIVIAKDHHDHVCDFNVLRNVQADISFNCQVCWHFGTQ